VVPFTAGEHLGLNGPFTLLEFDGGLPDVLYMDAGRMEFASIVAGGDPQVADCRDEFEALAEGALSAGESVELIRGAAESMSSEAPPSRINKIHSLN
jgi:Domain of unknown function (DUF5753)